MKSFLKLLSKEIKNKKTISPKEILKLRNKLAREYSPKQLPSLVEILLSSNLPIITKPTKTISGVAPIAIMTKPFKCPHVKKGIGPCIMCPGGPNSFFGDVPQSYTGKEPATLRAIRNKYDPYLQIFNRLEQYIVLGHNIDKVELIIMGGTFLSFPLRYQKEFITYALKALNDFSIFFTPNFNINKFKKFFELPSKDIGNKERINKIQEKLLKLKSSSQLKKEQKRNETSNIRCVALVIETRPDYGKLKHGNLMLDYGCTRVELGVQTTNDFVLKKIKRGHTVKDSVDSIRILKDLGFKIGFHGMIGLPNITPKEDLEILKEYFSNSKFKPDLLKIYPCMVLKGTKLYDLYKNKKFNPITTKEAMKLIAEFKKFIPSYCRVSRIQRDISSNIVEDGVDKTNFRQLLHNYMKEHNIICNCIRCREPKNKKISEIKYLIKEYEASRGKEFFISAEDTKNNLILGFCRLRFPSSLLRKEITKNSALIRELHVYGTLTKIGKPGLIQHKGIGKKLMNIAENICIKNNKKKLLVLSGIGVRPYFKKLKYQKEGPYMSKKLQSPNVL